MDETVKEELRELKRKGFYIFCDDQGGRFGWETRSRTSIHGVRVAFGQEIKSNARKIKAMNILRKPKIVMDDG